MATPITFESIDVSTSSHPEEPRARTQTDASFKILIMGDFSGRTNRGEETDGSDIDRRKLYRVDRDNDETVLEKMGVSLCLSAAGDDTPAVKLAFEEIDDFHPEQIYYRTSIFKTLKQTRSQLIDPDTAAAMVQRLSGTPAAQKETEHESDQLSATPGIDFSQETTAGLLDQVLDVSSSGSADAGGSRPQTDWDRFLDGIVRPHLVPDSSPEQDAMITAIDDAISETMRRILHHPDFQALESNWRALRFCLRRLETDETLMIVLMDVTKSELVSDLTAHDDIRDTALYKKLSSVAVKGSDDVSWGLLAGAYTFSSEKMDVVLLAQLGAVGQLLDAPFVGQADTRLVGCPSLSERPDPSQWRLQSDAEDTRAWQVMRRLPEAGWVGLTMPRFIMRLPYGEATDPVDAFAFEEVHQPVDHEDYLWANPIFAVVLMLGKTYAGHGWNWSQGLNNTVSELPMHLVDDNGQQAIKPCAEALLSDRALEFIISNGLMPLASSRNQGGIRLVRFQSIADPPAPLSGAWTR
jgi:type VI secretion system protein ImpC